jgi:ectoine hydroxylase-related dioxygenase (phytanoyl-CoA dioxygenase family)
MVRATLFDKTTGANWGVFWHRDLSIAVRERHPLPDFHAWTRKAGVQCVQPPTHIMDRIVALRLHLDDCDEANGALSILPGTHRRLSLSDEDIEQLERDDRQVRCDVASGSGLLMKPLVLHASSPMTTGSGRRVIHFEFAASELPEPLDWKYRIYCDGTVQDGLDCDG